MSLVYFIYCLFNDAARSASSLIAVKTLQNQKHRRAPQIPHTLVVVPKILTGDLSSTGHKAVQLLGPNCSVVTNTKITGIFINFPRRIIWSDFHWKRLHTCKYVYILYNTNSCPSRHREGVLGRRSLAPLIVIVGTIRTWRRRLCAFNKGVDGPSTDIIHAPFVN